MLPTLIFVVILTFFVHYDNMVPVDPDSTKLSSNDVSYLEHLTIFPVTLNCAHEQKA